MQRHYGGIFYYNDGNGESTGCGEDASFCRWNYELSQSECHPYPRCPTTTLDIEVSRCIPFQQPLLIDLCCIADFNPTQKPVFFFLDVSRLCRYGILLYRSSTSSYMYMRTREGCGLDLHCYPICEMHYYYSHSGQ